MTTTTEESAPLLRRAGAEDITTTNDDGAPVSRVGVGLAALATVAFFALVAFSANLVPLHVGGGGNDDDHHGKEWEEGLLRLEKAVLEDAMATSDLGGNILTPACRAEVIGHQRIFVKGLEHMFTNGCGGPHFDPISLRDTMLREEGSPTSSANCDQEFMDQVFVRTFSRVYQWMCKRKDTTLNLVMGFSTALTADDFTPDVKGAISLALASTEGLRTDQVMIETVMSASDAQNDAAYEKLLAPGLKCADGKSPDVVLVVRVHGDDLATSLLTVTHFKHAAHEGLITAEIQEEYIDSIQCSVVLGWLTPPPPRS